MNQPTLSDEERRIVVEYRIEKAQRTFQQAKINFDMKLVETAANRFYYAAYYAVSALLIKNKITANTHNGVKGMFGLHFIKTGLYSTDEGRLYNNLFNKRQTGDYDDNFDLELSDLEPLVEPTRLLIEHIADDIKKEQ